MRRVLAVGAAGIAAAALLAWAPAPAVALTPPTATPAECTITGTQGPDVLRGTPGDDVICGRGGRDVIIGLSGHDILRGGPGADRLVGGSGDDVLAGGSGADWGSGGRGDDVCSADPALVGCVVDQAAPTITDVSIPDEVTAGGNLVMSWTATDDVDVDVDVVSWARVGGRNGWEAWCFDTLPLRQTESSRFTLTCPVPGVISNGDYTVFMGAADSFGHYSEKQVGFRIAGGSDDASAPAVIAPPVLPDVEPGETFTLRWTLSDPSGVSFTEAWIYTPEYSLVGYDQKPGSITTGATLVSGDVREGEWEQTYSLSPEASAGSYLVTLSVRDAVGNRDVLIIGSLSVGGPPVTECSLDPTAADCAPREPSAFVDDIDLPATVSPGEEFVISWVAQGAEGFTSFAGVSGAAMPESWCGESYVVEAVQDPGSGRFSVTCRVPQVVRNGTYTVSIVVQGPRTGYVQAFVTLDVVGGSEGDLRR